MMPDPITLTSRAMHTQHGTVLLVTMAMLIAFTLFVLGMVGMAGSEFRTIHNQQLRSEMDRAGMEAIEIVMNSQTAFNNAASKTATAQSYTVNGYNVSVSAPTCYGTSSLKYSALSNVAAYEVNWELTANVTDPRSGATIQVVEGVRMRMGIDSCPT